MKVVSAGKKPFALRPGLLVCEGLALVGLGLTLNSMVHTTGLTFTLFTVVGTPMLLLGIVILAYLLVDDLRKRYSLFTVEIYVPGETIIAQGDPADRAYFVQRGQVEVIRDEHGKQTVVARMGAGDYFGEMALLNRNARRTATVRAAGDVELLVLGKENFYRLIEAIPNLHQQFLARAAERRRGGEPGAADSI